MGLKQTMRIAHAHYFFCHHVIQTTHVTQQCNRCRVNIHPHLIHASMGNPFHMNGEADRNRVCDAYEEWIASPNAASHKRIIERMIQRVQEGKSIALYCHCAPKRCHCETIRELALNP